MLNKRLPSPAIFFLAFLMCLNLYCFIQNFKNVIPRVLTNSFASSPGFEFECLRPYLINVRKAGYYTSQPSNHPYPDTKIVWGFVQAQYALSPTILDLMHPWDHEYVVYLSGSNGYWGDKIEQRGYKRVIALRKGIFIFKRI